MYNSPLICILLGVVAFFYYDKYKRMSLKYKKLIKSHNELKLQQHAKDIKLKEMNLYKEDVSKTFKILDNELGLINNHLRSNSNQVSLLTPNVLDNLLSNVNQEITIQNTNTNTNENACGDIIQMEVIDTIEKINQESNIESNIESDKRTSEEINKESIQTINQKNNEKSHNENDENSGDKAFYSFYDNNEENYEKFLLN